MCGAHGEEGGALAALGIPPKEILDATGRCPQCGESQPPADVCHVCGARGEAGDFWRTLLKRDLPDEGPEAGAIRSAGAEVGFVDKNLKESGLCDFFARHSVTSQEERVAWGQTMRAYFGAYQTGLDLAQWEILHPPGSKK